MIFLFFFVFLCDIAVIFFFFFFQAEDGIRDIGVTGVQTCALPILPAFEVLDAVGGNVAEMGHTASFYWQGKMPAAAFFTTVPFGLTPGEHVAWVDAGGGQAL